MRSPERVLEQLQQHARDANYGYQRLYRNLFNPAFYWLAYQNVYANRGAMTPGTDGQTVDAMGDARIAALIASIRSHRYQPQPARREYIPKKNGGQRPLGIPSANDKLVQEVVRLLLTSIYEPTFSPRSHGFRPQRSCHTALQQIQETFTGTKWFVEGDIRAYFDSIDHHTLVGLLRRRIHDEAFLGLIWKFLKAGYLEEWTWHATYSGAPQGSGLSPLLANLYLNELDQYLTTYKTQFDRGARRALNPDYARLSGRIQGRRRYLRKQGTLWSPERQAQASATIHDLRQALLTLPATDPMDPGYRRIQYTRYADDFLIGVIGSRADAEQVKADVAKFLETALYLTLSPEKTLITPARHKARFLGYDVTMSRARDLRPTKRGLVRTLAQRVQLLLPKDRWMGKLQALGVLKIVSVPGHPERWVPLQRNDLMTKSLPDIVAWYNAQMRGLYNYYRLARNVSGLQKASYVLEYSLYKTFSGKLRTSVSQVTTRFTQDGVFGVGYTTKTGPRRVTWYHGGFARIPKPLWGPVDNLPTPLATRRKEVVQRFLTRVCELCRTQTAAVTIHQVRALAELPEALPWAELMRRRHRKTLVVCDACHATIHAG
ncbi:MAG: reverse transcriptase domain-containing protein [Thermaerobacter sp.]|nr:reverse transcriptase domain-containing protein [Thermaerobacter sp.]